METCMLPVSDFKWVSEKVIKSWTSTDILNLPPQTEIGYAFEVDLNYPKKYHKVITGSILLNTYFLNNF